MRFLSCSNETAMPYDRASELSGSALRFTTSAVSISHCALRLRWLVVLAITFGACANCWKRRDPTAIIMVL
jgi:hypothetical protein